MARPPDWFGSGHLTVIVVEPNGQLALAHLHFTVLPLPDAAAIAGTDTGTRTEGHVLTEPGGLTGIDPDPGEAQFLATPLTGGFGRLQIDSDGRWTYSLDNNAHSVQSLVSGQTKQETLTVTVTDSQGATGTDTENLVITVTGTNDGPAVQTGDLGATQPGAGKTLSATDLLAAVHATDVDTGDQLSISNVQVDPQYGSFHQSGSNWVFTPTTGASQTDVPSDYLRH